jgi:hypothetical protein
MLGLQANRHVKQEHLRVQRHVQTRAPYTVKVSSRNAKVNPSNSVLYTMAGGLLWVRVRVS